MKLEGEKLATAMIERVLRWNDIDPHGLTAIMREEIFRLGEEGATEREFVKWCRAQYDIIGPFQPEWASLLFSSVVLAGYAHEHKATWKSGSHLRPFWKIDCLTQFCSQHAETDGFVARFDDPIWNFLYPPNGWLCGCCVTGLTVDDLKDERDLKFEVSPRLASRCANWLNKYPRHALSLL